MKIVEGSLAPTQKFIPFPIAGHFNVYIRLECAERTGFIYLDGMINNQVCSGEGINSIRVTSEISHGISHRSEVNYCGYSGEVLHQDTGGPIGYFLVYFAAFQY